LNVIMRFKEKLFENEKFTSFLLKSPIALGKICGLRSKLL